MCETHRTVFDTVCETTQEVHDVVDDFVTCQTVNKEVCRDVQDGFTTTQQCDQLPQEKCSIVQQTVKKYSPKVQCNKFGREICSAGCAIKEVSKWFKSNYMFTNTHFTRLLQFVRTR